jgi:RNA polymerase sigma factor (sigma-70 family)
MNNMPDESPDINIAFEEYQKNPTEKNYEKIFTSADRLIEKFISSAYNKQKSREDLIQSGYLGLTKAIKSYKGDLGAKFSTWASTCIISEIRHEVRKEQKFFNVSFSGESDFSKGLVSLNFEDGTSILEERPDEKAESATNEHMDLKLILESLSELDRQIVDYLFFKDMSQDAVAEKLGISQKKVSRQKNKIISLVQAEMLGEPSDFKLMSDDKSFTRQPSPLDKNSFKLVESKNDKPKKEKSDADNLTDFKLMSDDKSFTRQPSSLDKDSFKLVTKKDDKTKKDKDEEEDSSDFKVLPNDETFKLIKK